MTLEPLSNLDRSTLRVLARRSVAIVSGRCRRGDRAEGEVELAARLGVSREADARPCGT